VRFYRSGIDHQNTQFHCLIVSATDPSVGGFHNDTIWNKPCRIWAFYGVVLNAGEAGFAAACLLLDMSRATAHTDTVSQSLIVPRGEGMASHLVSFFLQRWCADLCGSIDVDPKNNPMVPMALDEDVMFLTIITELASRGPTVHFQQ